MDWKWNSWFDLTWLIPRRNPLNTRNQVSTKPILVHATISTCRDDARQQVNRIMLAHHQDLEARHILPQNAGYFQSINVRHAYIEENQVGEEFRRFQKRLCAVFGFATDFPVRLRRQKSDHSAANYIVIICNENTQSCPLSWPPYPAILSLCSWRISSVSEMLVVETGSVTEIFVPPSFDRMFMTPLKWRTRSRIPAMPTPERCA
jgi:hypothetical protein